MSLLYISFLASFVIGVLLCILYIPTLRKIKYGQIIRAEGPRSHYSKKGTPTMGGLFIVFSSIITFILLGIYALYLDYHYMFLIIMPFIMYASIGFIDDFLIVVRRKNEGLSPTFKMALQIIWAGVYYYVFLDKGLSTVVNFFGKSIDLKWFYGILILIMLTSTSNAVNLTDGLDGLATGLVLISLIPIIIFSYKSNKEVLYFSIMLFGSLLAFLCFNFHPAKLFMGDTGSLALGAILASFFIIIKREMLLIVIAFPFIIETLSVIIQVTYFKITRGKRIFLMTPLHHHFELKGLNEWKVNLIFWIIGIISMLIGLYLGGIWY